MQRHVVAVSRDAATSTGTLSKSPSTIIIGPRKRPVGRPRKAAVRASVMAASPKLVDYSSTDSESSSEGPSPICPSTKKRIHRMYSRGQKEKVAYCARHHGIRDCMAYIIRIYKDG